MHKIQFLIVRMDADRQAHGITVLIRQRNAVRDVSISREAWLKTRTTTRRLSIETRVSQNMLHEKCKDCRHQRSSVCPLSTTPLSLYCRCTSELPYAEQTVKLQCIVYVTRVRRQGSLPPPTTVPYLCSSSSFGSIYSETHAPTTALGSVLHAPNGSFKPRTLWPPAQGLHDSRRSL